MKAPRDMTRAQFDAALKANGFRKIFHWIEDRTGSAPGVSWGVIFSVQNGKIARRATLAHVMRQREAIAKHQGRAA